MRLTIMRRNYQQEKIDGDGKRISFPDHREQEETDEAFVLCGLPMVWRSRGSAPVDGSCRVLRFGWRRSVGKTKAHGHYGKPIQRLNRSRDYSATARYWGFLEQFNARSDGVGNVEFR